MNTVRFTYRPQMPGYGCSEPGDMNGNYVKVPPDDDDPISADWLTTEYAVEVGETKTCTGWLVSTINRPGCYVTTVRVLDLGDDSYMLEATQHDPDDEPKYSVGISFHVGTRGQLRRLVAAMEGTV